MRKYGQLVFVDLAGSERLNSTGSTDVDAVKEACAINQSLFTLGQVLQGLSARAKGVTKPVRYAQLPVPEEAPPPRGGAIYPCMRICSASTCEDPSLIIQHLAVLRVHACPAKSSNEHSCQWSKTRWNYKDSVCMELGAGAACGHRMLISTRVVACSFG